MALADTLRERASRRGRTAQVDCGTLGTLTVEALPPGDCAALSAKDDGGRAVLYAACRELQQSGEALRREGLLFTPDEIMQYVTDGEIASAARTVLVLSGVELVEPDGLDSGESQEPAYSPDSADSTAEDTAGSRSFRVPDEPAGNADHVTADTQLEAVVDAKQQSPESKPETAWRQAPEVPLQAEVLWKSEKHIPKIQPDTVRKPSPQKAAPPPGAEPASEAAAGGEAALYRAASRPGKVDGRLNPDKHLQNPPMGPEYESEHTVRTKQRAAQSIMADEGSAPVDGRDLREATSVFSNPPGEVAPPSRQAGDTAAHEMRPDARNPLNEPALELGETGAPERHESTPEHPEIAPESKVEFQESPHKATLDFDRAEQPEAYETAPDRREPLHEITSESAQRMARLLLEGLRRAAAVR